MLALKIALAVKQNQEKGFVFDDRSADAAAELITIVVIFAMPLKLLNQLLASSAELWFAQNTFHRKWLVPERVTMLTCPSRARFARPPAP